MSTLDVVREISQIVYSIALSVTGPLALVGYLRAKKREQEEREYKTFDELDNKLLEYHKLALQHDLDLIDVPDAHPLFQGDRIRKRQELAAYGVSFALFQRAFLMFRAQSDQFRHRQWAGWDLLLARFVRRANVQDVWQIVKSHHDLRFQGYVDRQIVEAMTETGEDPAVIHAFETTGLLIRDSNEHLASAEDLARWRAALERHRARPASAA